MGPLASAVGATVAGGMQAGATCAEPPLGEQSVDKQVHVEQQQDLLMAGYEAYSPGTPVDSPAIKVEYEWPEADWDDAVIDLEEQHDLLTAWQSSSEEESSGCSDSSGGDCFEWDVDEDEDAATLRTGGVTAKWHINVKTNVINELRNETTFRCGRPLGQTYVAVPALTGLRCGKCFAHCI